MRLAIAYAALWLFIAFVSAYDTYVNIRYPVTAAVELNPVAKLILQCGDDNLALLMSMKLFGTSLVLGSLLLFYFYDRGKALFAASAVALFQLWVLIFLSVY